MRKIKNTANSLEMKGAEIKQRENSSNQSIVPMKSVEARLKLRLFSVGRRQLISLVTVMNHSRVVGARKARIGPKFLESAIFPLGLGYV